MAISNLQVQWNACPQHRTDGGQVLIWLTRQRLVLASSPQDTQVASQVGRPDDGSDASGFYNTEFSCGFAAEGEMEKRVSHERQADCSDG